MSTPAPARAPSDRRTSTLGSSSSKRQSTALPKPSSIFLDPSVLIAQHAQLTGTHPITVGPNTVLHPHCKISSAHAPVVMWEGVVVYERARVGVENPRVMRTDTSRGDGVVLGKNVVIETGCVIEASEIGEGSVIEVGANIGVGCVIGEFCTISASTLLPPNTHIPDFTVVYSGLEKRVNKTLQSRPELQQAKVVMHTKQLEIFKKLVPNNVSKWT
ncbi:trimeric LpxA-like protein [Clohesyomyces aquaticus]|uniref:Dynactin subunit 6 n=1 Tax=Clohesyomyces aquaticus TaxID=1231657 RepID=A0A1Y1ZRK1_9PLEO|nr:trimeric LpxA-like protein [Clohesyomyces aquaticus]